MLGEYFKNGEHVPRDYKRALEYFRQVGGSAGITEVGHFYRDGLGVDQDYFEAIKIYSSALNIGNNEEAKTAIYDIYEKRLGIPKDPSDLATYHRIGVQLGFTTSTVSFGIAHLNGRGVEQSYPKAAALFSKAAKAGSLDAVFLLARMIEQGRGFSEKSPAEAFKLYMQAAEKGHARSQRRVGAMYLQGIGVNTDLTKGVEWTRKAANQGNRDAENLMGALHVDGLGVVKDEKQEAEWFQKAAQQGLVDAQFTLGGAYIQGQGVEKDYKQAFKWYQKASEQGDSRSQANLGQLYHRGLGVPANYVLAYQWMTLAAAEGDEAAIKNMKALEPKMTAEQIAQAQSLAAACLKNKYKGCVLPS